jgi:hypothetical protein
MNKSNNRKAMLPITVGLVDPTAGARAFSTFIYNLQEQMEALGGLDGAKVQIKNIRFHMRFYSNEEFAVQLALVQTAGAWTTTDDLDIAIVDAILNSCIDDVFGSYLLNQMQYSKRVPSDDMTAAAPQSQGLYITAQLPQHLIQLINKEVETERLQELKFGFCGFNQAAENIEYNGYVEVDFITVRKNVTIR